MKSIYVYLIYIRTIIANWKTIKFNFVCQHQQRQWRIILQMNVW